MSGDQTYYYDPTTGLQFLNPVPINQVPPPISPSTSLAVARTPELAPLGSFQNPYPANSVIPPTVQPSISTSTTSTQYALATAACYDLPHWTQTTEIPVQYFQPMPLLCRCDAFSEDQQRDIVPTQDHSHVSTSWWLAPSIPSPSEPRQQQTVMACTHSCGQAVTFPAAPPSAHPHTHANPSFPLPIPAATTINNRAHSSPQPSPFSSRPPPNPIPTRSATPFPSDQPRSVAGPFPFPRADRVPNRTSKPDAKSKSESDFDFDFDFDFESDYGAMRWPHCYVCNRKPALREKEGVLFCRGCWAEAEQAEVEMGREMGRERER